MTRRLTSCEHVEQAREVIGGQSDPQSVPSSPPYCHRIPLSAFDSFQHRPRDTHGRAESIRIAKSPSGSSSANRLLGSTVRRPSQGAPSPISSLGRIALCITLRIVEVTTTKALAACRPPTVSPPRCRSGVWNERSSDSCSG